MQEYRLTDQARCARTDRSDSLRMRLEFMLIENVNVENTDKNNRYQIIK